MSVSDASVRPNDLLALFKLTGPETRSHIRSAEFLDNTVELIREMVYTHSMDKPQLNGTHAHTVHIQLSSHPLNAAVVCVSELLSTEDTEIIQQVTGCSSETIRPVCTTDCLSKRYRTITGHCNNRCTYILTAAHHPKSYITFVFVSAERILCGEQRTRRTPAGSRRSTRTLEEPPEAGTRNTPTITTPYHPYDLNTY